MSYRGWSNSVRLAAIKIANIQDVEIQLTPPAAVITISKCTDVSKLQKSGHKIVYRKRKNG